MKNIKYDDLRMIAFSNEGVYSLEICIASGFVDFDVSVEINGADFEVIANNKERASFLQAALHDPFQLKVTTLSKEDQRQYLDIILHAAKPIVERFLTEKDHATANGAISNMLRITSKKDYSKMRKGLWFES